MNKSVPFEVEDKPYVAIFNKYYAKSLDRFFTQCTLVVLPERLIASGTTMCHKNDVFQSTEGERISFRRAVLFLLLLTERTCNIHYSLNEIKSTIKLFQKAMGAEKYKIYGKEEK